MRRAVLAMKNATAWVAFLLVLVLVGVRSWDRLLGVLAN
jgi:hypothetical protein